jgi:integrase
MPDISIGRLRGGFCVYWRDGAGRRRRHQLAARTRKDAEAEAVEVYRAQALLDRPADPTVADVWAAYRAELGDRPTGRNLEYAGKAVLPHFGAYRPASVDKALCVTYAKARADAGRSQGTIWTELGYLRSALRFAAASRMIDRAPTVWRPAKPQSDKRILDAGECRRLIDAAHDPHIRLALVLLLGTAGRVGAILDLTWDRVDFERGIINLRLADSATRKGRAVVPMNGATRAALDVAQRAALSDCVIEYGGGPVKSIRKGVQNAVTRAKLGHVRIHDLRHTAAVHMLAAGIPIEKVGQVLGHSNVGVTYSTYARFLPQHMADAVNVLDFTNLRKGA